MKPTEFKNDSIIILILVSSVTLLAISSSFYEYSSSGEVYEFEFNAQGTKTPIYANAFNLYYDFTDKNGTIQFKFSDDYGVENIIINFPKLLNRIAEIKIFDCENLCNNESNITYRKEQKEHPRHIQNYTMIILSDFSDSLEDKLIQINFSLNLEPNSVFHIFNNERFILYQSRDYIELDLGKSYSCFGSCVSYLYNLEKDAKTVGNKIYLDNFTEELYQHSFSLATRNEGILFWKNLLLALGASLFAGWTLYILQRISKS